MGPPSAPPRYRCRAFLTIGRPRSRGATTGNDSNSEGVMRKANFGAWAAAAMRLAA